jgi:hypothetical protein
VTSFFFVSFFLCVEGPERKPLFCLPLLAPFYMFSKAFLASFFCFLANGHMQSCPCNVYTICNILLTLPEIKWGAGKNILWLTHSKLLDFSWVGQRGRVHDSKVSFVFWDRLDNQSTTKKKFLLNIWVHGQSEKCWVPWCPRWPTHVKVHSSSNFVYMGST